jgi:hypothetical protein
MNAGTLAVAATLTVGTAIGAVAYQATSHHAPLPPASNVTATTPSRVATAAALDPCLADPNDPACTVVVPLPPAAAPVAPVAQAAQAAPAAPAATPSSRGATAEARHGADDGPNHDANDDHGGDRSGSDDGSDRSGSDDGSGRSGHDDGSGHDAGDDHGSDG